MDLVIRKKKIKESASTTTIFGFSRFKTRLMIKKMLSKKSSGEKWKPLSANVPLQNDENIFHKRMGNFNTFCEKCVLDYFILFFIAII